MSARADFRHRGVQPCCHVAPGLWSVHRPPHGKRRWSGGLPADSPGADVWQVALGVARWAATQSIPPARKHLRDQLLRAADSVVLNMAEGAGHDPGESRRHHFRMSAGSAAEVCAVLDLVALPGGPEKQDELRRVGAMLARMVR